MKEMLKSKVMMLFAVMVLGVVFVDSIRCVKLEESENTATEIVMADLK